MGELNSENNDPQATTSRQNRAFFPRTRRRMETFDAFLRILLEPADDEELEPLLGSSHEFPLMTAQSRLPESISLGVPMTLTSPFPNAAITLRPPCVDKSPSQPVYFGSAIISDDLIVPCKITPRLWPSVCHVPLDGREVVHRGRFVILPFDPEKMELVPSAQKSLPTTSTPIVGGRDASGEPLYHTVGWYNGLRVPGKVSARLAAKVCLKIIVRWYTSSRNIAHKRESAK